MCAQWFDKRESKQFFQHVHGLNELKCPESFTAPIKLKVAQYQQIPRELAFG
jgi:hypothetical protein